MTILNQDQLKAIANQSFIPQNIQQGYGVADVSDKAYHPEPVSTVDNEGAVNAQKLHTGGTLSMPEPTLPATQQMFQVGLEDTVNNAQQNLQTTLKEERDQALKRQDDLNNRLQNLMQNQNPENRDTYDQEKRITQNQLNASETASASLEEDFQRRRDITNELQHLLTQGNQLIDQAKNQPVSMAVLNKSVTNAAQAVQARAGVLQSTLSALTGNINVAHSIINNASNAVSAMWNDQLAYNQAYMTLVQNGQLTKNKIHTDYANAQIALAQDKLDQAQKTRDYLKSLMIDPKSAQFIADAGVTLNDSVETINQKLAEQQDYEDRQDTINELTKDGYEYVPFPGNRSDVVTLTVRGKELAFVPPTGEGEDLKFISGSGVDYAVNPRTGEVVNTYYGSSGSGTKSGSTKTGNAKSDDYETAKSYVISNPEGKTADQLISDLRENSDLSAGDISALVKAYGPKDNSSEESDAEYLNKILNTPSTPTTKESGGFLHTLGKFGKGVFNWLMGA